MTRNTSKSIKKTSYRQTTEATKIINFLIIVGVIVAAVAPFLHVFFSKESTTRIFGYPNMRVFLFSIGLPISLFILSLLIAFVSNLVELKLYRKSLKFGSGCFLFTSSYFIVWTLWYRGDFNVYAYYIAMIIVSLIASLTITSFLSSITKQLLKLKSIAKRIPTLDEKIKTVNDIANIMPDDNDDLITYKLMMDVTGDNLKDTISEIKEDLN